MRVALLSVEYPPDPFSAGIGSYTQAMANALTAKGHTVHVITRGDADSVTTESGVSVHRLIPKRPELPQGFKPLEVTKLVATALVGELRYRQKIAKRLHELIETEGLDLIEAADFMAEGLFYQARRYPNIPFIVRLHTPFAYAERIESYAPEAMRLAMRQLERNQLFKASHITAPSRVSANIFAKELKLKKAIHVMPNLPSFDPAKIQASGVTDANTVLFVGRINKWKGVHVLVKAIPKIMDTCPEAKFIFVGADHVPLEGHATASAYMKSLIPENFHAHIEFTGRLPHNEVARHLSKASVCVFPSLFDNFPYSCLEAMLYGKAIVGSNQGGMVELLEGGQAGLLYTPPDDAELAEAIISLLKNSQKRTILGKKAKDRAHQTYNFDTVLDETLQFYQQAMSERQ